MGIRLAIGADHAGYELKELLISSLTLKGFQFSDFGTNGPSSMDYPDVVHPLCKEVASGLFNFGVLICGSGQGVAITANKYSKIRAAIVWNNNIAQLARQHNDANIICLPARFITASEAEQFIITFVNTLFEGGRHQKRIDKIWV